MPFLGQQPVEGYKTTAKQTITGDGNTSYTLDNAVTNGTDLEVFVNNVRQEPGTDYSASGNTITFTTAVESSDSCWLVYQGRASTTSLVGTDNIASGAVTVAKLAPGAGLPDAIDVNASAPADSLAIDASGNVSFSGPAGIEVVAPTVNNHPKISSTSSGGITSSFFQQRSGAGTDTIIERSDVGTVLTIDSSGHLIAHNGITLGTSVGVYNANNNLDDYEEGTWTPGFASEGGTTLSVTNVDGSYVKIGSVVHITFRMSVTSSGSGITSYANITGLPFSIGRALSPDTGFDAYSYFSEFTNISGVNSGDMVVGVFDDQRGDKMRIFKTSAGSVTILTTDAWTGNEVCRFTGWYFTDS